MSCITIPKGDLPKIAISVLRSALEIGYTQFDTAEFFGFGRSEPEIKQLNNLA